MKQYKDIFIDFDDTLYDTSGCAQDALIQLYEERGLDKYFQSAMEFSNSYWKWNVKLWSDYAKGLISRPTLIVERFRGPLNEAKPEMDFSDEYCLDINNYFLQLTMRFPKLIDGAKELLDYLKEKGYRIHICSNGFSELQYKKLKATGLDGFFDTVILSEHAGANKPSRQFFEYALSQAKADIATTLMIGDNYDTDIVGAMNSGIDGMLYNRWEKTFVPDGPVTYIVAELSDIKKYL